MFSRSQTPKRYSLAPLYAILAGLMLGLLILTALPASAAASCLAIHDRDLRALCQAKAERRPVECLAIRDRDMRAYCRAVSRKEK